MQTANKSCLQLRAGHMKTLVPITPNASAHPSKAAHVRGGGPAATATGALLYFVYAFAKTATSFECTTARAEDSCPLPSMPAPSKRDSDATSLRRKLDELYDLRCTEPEQEAKRLAASLEEVQRSSDALVTSLRRQLTQQAADAIEAVEPAHELDALQARVERLERQAAAYEMLTGLSVDVGKDGRTISCCCKGEERAHEFAVDLFPEDGDAGDLGYQPASGDGLCKELPDYLQDGIICAHSQRAPIMPEDIIHAPNPSPRPSQSKGPKHRLWCARSLVS